MTDDRAIDAACRGFHEAYGRTGDTYSAIVGAIAAYEAEKAKVAAAEDRKEGWG